MVNLLAHAQEHGKIEPGSTVTLIAKFGVGKLTHTTMNLPGQMTRSEKEKDSVRGLIELKIDVGSKQPDGYFPFLKSL